MKPSASYDYAEYERARRRADMTNAEVAVLLDVSLRTLDRWKAGWKRNGRVTLDHPRGRLLEQELGLSRLEGLDGREREATVVRLSPSTVGPLREVQDAVRDLLDGQQRLFETLDEILDSRDEFQTRLGKLEGWREQSESGRKRSPRRRSK